MVSMIRTYSGLFFVARLHSSTWIGDFRMNGVALVPKQSLRVNTDIPKFSVHEAVINSKFSLNSRSVRESFILFIYFWVAMQARSQWTLRQAAVLLRNTSRVSSRSHWASKKSLSPISSLIFSGSFAELVVVPLILIYLQTSCCQVFWLSQHDRWHDPNAQHAARATACQTVDWVQQSDFQRCFQ